VEQPFDFNNDMPDANATENLLAEVNHIISFSERREQEILLHHFGPESQIETNRNNRFREARLNQQIDEEQIRRTCVKYRLRFLPSNLYSGTVPFEVVACMKRYEHEQYPTNVKFFVLAPIDFYLKKQQYKSPLLFAEKDSGNYAMLCQWGVPRPWYQQVLRYPFRDMRSLMLSSFTFGLFICITAGFLGLASGITIFHSFLYKVPLFVLSSGAFSTASLIYGLVTRTDFSSDNWNKRYFRKG
jgi:hypothetical protein